MRLLSDENLRQKQHALPTAVPLLLHNARPHIAKMTTQKLKELSQETPPPTHHIHPHRLPFLQVPRQFLEGEALKQKQGEIEEEFNVATSDREFFKSGMKEVVERQEQVAESDGFTTMNKAVCFL